MKSNKKQLTLLIVIFLSISTFNLTVINSNLKSGNIISVFSNQFPKSSAVINTTITIDDTNPGQDWETRKSEGVCTGSGTAGDPYIISNHLFNITAGGDCLEILNSRKHFRIVDCDFITTGLSAAIYLQNNTYGRVQGNHITNIFGGIIIDNCSQITFIDNNVTLCGFSIIVGNSDNLVFNLNLVDQSVIGFGIDIDNCVDCTFTQNTVTEGVGAGINFEGSNRLIFDDNIIFNNPNGIVGFNSNNTVIELRTPFKPSTCSIASMKNIHTIHHTAVPVPLAIGY